MLVTARENAKLHKMTISLITIFAVFHAHHFEAESRENILKIIVMLSR